METLIQRFGASKILLFYIVLLILFTTILRCLPAPTTFYLIKQPGGYYPPLADLYKLGILYPELPGLH